MSDRCQIGVVKKNALTLPSVLSYIGTIGMSMDDLKESVGAELKSHKCQIGVR